MKPNKKEKALQFLATQAQELDLGYDNTSDWDNTLMDGLEDEPWEDPTSAIDWLIDKWPILSAKIPPQVLDDARAIEKQLQLDAYTKGHEDREKDLFNTQQFKNK
jgi:hypothetical protein